MVRTDPKTDRFAPHADDALTLEVPSRYIYVKPVRDFVTSTAALLGFEREQCQELGLVVTEICNNAIEYGSDAAADDYNVIVQVLDDRVVITTRDHGTGEISPVDFQKLLEDAPDVGEQDDIDMRGRGLFLIQAMVDTVEIRPVDAEADDDAGTEVVVTKLLPSS